MQPQNLCLVWFWFIEKVFIFVSSPLLPLSPLPYAIPILILFLLASLCTHYMSRSESLAFRWPSSRLLTRRLPNGTAWGNRYGEEKKREEDIRKLGGRSNHFLSPQKVDVQLGDLKTQLDGWCYWGQVEARKAEAWPRGQGLGTGNCCWESIQQGIFVLQEVTGTFPHKTRRKRKRKRRKEKEKKRREFKNRKLLIIFQDELTTAKTDLLEDSKTLFVEGLKDQIDEIEEQLWEAEDTSAARI